MTPELRTMLDQIDTFLAVGGADSTRLWEIMTALRGPDDWKQAGDKTYATSVIRTAAFPKTSLNPQVNADFADPRTAYIQPSYTTGSPHFASHARWAAIALGLYTG